MSQKVKAKVIKKKKPFPWGKIFYYLKSLFNNGVCFEIATSLKWFWSLIVFVFALLVSVVQPTVVASQIEGGRIITAPQSDTLVYGLTNYLEDATEDKENKLTITFKANELIGTYPQDRYKDYVTESSLEGIYKPLHTTFREGKRMLDIYVSTSHGDESKYLANVLQSNPIYGDATDKEREDISKAGAKYVRSTSCLIFTNKFVYCVLFDANGNQRATLNGNYNYVTEAFPKLSETPTYTFKDVLNYGLTATEPTEIRQTLIQNSKLFFDKAYADVVFQQTWITFGTYCGVNGGIMIIMGLIVFAMTRGKNNPNRSIKFLQCFSIAFWFSITPALIAISLGFLLPQFGPMLFLMAYSFRIMFLSMKYLRPAYN